MKLEKTPAYNVIGTITGREEPGTTFEYLVFILFRLHEKCLINYNAIEYVFLVYWHLNTRRVGRIVDS